MMPFPRLAALAALTMLSACAAAAPAAHGAIAMTERQSVTVAPGAVLRYESVTDSRCPPDVRCIVAGKVAYSFTLKLGDTRERFTLTPAEPAFTSAALGGKRIVLSDAPPPPVAKAAGAVHPVSIQVVAP